MDIKNFETFIQVADQNRFTKAAKKLGYTQSAVSAQIKQLALAHVHLGAQRMERYRLREMLQDIALQA